MSLITASSAKKIVRRAPPPPLLGRRTVLHRLDVIKNIHCQQKGLKFQNDG